MNYTILRTSSNLQIEVMVGHLRNTALVLCTQRSSRHMNFRMGGLMFDSKFNSKQSSTRDLAKEILQTPILRKRILLADKSDDFVLYHIAIAKFGNCCSMLVFPFRRRRQRSYVLFCDVFSDVIFYPHVLQQLRGLKTIPVLPCLDL